MIVGAADCWQIEETESISKSSLLRDLCDLLFNLFGVSISGRAPHSVLLENFEDLVDDASRLPLTDTNRDDFV